jgi:hypothetical protein
MKTIILVAGLAFVTIVACDTPQPTTGTTEDSTSINNNPDSIKMNTPDTTMKRDSM